MWTLVALLLAGNGWMVQVAPIAHYATSTECAAGKAAIVRAGTLAELRVITASRILVCIPGQ